MKLALKHILKAAKLDPRLSDIDWDEPGKAIINLPEGWTWNALDDNRSVEGFVYSDNGVDEQDEYKYFKMAVQLIERVKN